MTQKTKALVLNALRYGDAGLIVNCYTQEFGIKAYFINGVYSSKKSKFKRSFFQPLNQLEIISNAKNNGQLNSVTDVFLLNNYQEIHTDPIKQGMTLFLSEILYNTLNEEYRDEKLFEFLNDAIAKLDEAKIISHFHLVFLIQLINHLGFSPVILENYSFFDLEEGKFTNTPLGRYFIQEPELYVFIKLLKCNFENYSELNFSYIERQKILDVIFQYMSLHITTFKKPKSIVVLKELFH